MLGRLDDGVRVTDHADADLLVGLVLREQRQILAVARGAFEGDDVAVQLQQMRQGALVARHVPIDALLVRIAPAAMYPDLGIDPGELAGERLAPEFHGGILAIRRYRQPLA